MSDSSYKDGIYKIRSTPRYPTYYPHFGSAESAKMSLMVFLLSILVVQGLLMTIVAFNNGLSLQVLLDPLHEMRKRKLRQRLCATLHSRTEIL